MNIDFTLSFDQTNWICYNKQVHLVAYSLDDLDKLIKKHLSEHYKKGHYTIVMQFDFNRFPTWMRQYMSHYFNRKIIFDID